jgi:uncharacterized protein
MCLMQIEIESLGREGRPFAHTYLAGELSLEDESLRLLEDVEVRGRARRKGKRVRLSGEIKTKLEKPCDRCLHSVILPVELAFEATFVSPDEELARESPVLEAEDLDASILEGSAIDMDEVVREQILLAADERTLCREKCRGLCPQCGVNLNDERCACESSEVDPRWDALGELRNKQGK